MNRSGLVSISFRALLPEEIVKISKDAGLAFIEWGSDVHAKPSDRERLSYIKRLTEDAGLKISSYGSYFKLTENDLAELPSYIDAAKVLGTGIIRIWCGNKNYTDMTEEEREALIEEARRAAKIAEDAGVKLCMECHNNTFTNCLEGAIRLMESVNSPAFRMYWQPNQFRTFQENCLYAEKMAKYTEVIHVFNWEGREMYPLSDGIEVWKKYLSYFDENIPLLLEFMPDNLPETLPREAEALFKIIR